MRRLALILGVSLVVGTPRAQVLRTGFERDVNRYRWTAAAAVAETIGRWGLTIDNRFVSDAYVQYDNRLRFRDENILRLRLERPLTGRLTAEIMGDMDWFGLSRAFSQGVYSSVSARLTPAATIAPLVGFAIDRRPGAPLSDGSLPRRLDMGPALGAWVLARRSASPGYRLDLSGQAMWQNINPRRGRAVQMAGGARRNYGVAELSTSVRVASRRRDTYQSVSFLNRASVRSETIEATISDTLDAIVELTAPLYGGLKLRAAADASANRRMIRAPQAPKETLFFNTNFVRRVLGVQIGITYDEPDMSAQLMVESTATSEDRRLTNGDALPPSEVAQKTNLLLQADYDEGLFGVSMSLRANVVPRLAVTLGGRSRILRHDTPEANPDDRDEVYHQGEAGLQWQVSPYVQADLRAFASWYHAVYLKASRSAENSVQRSLRLRPGLRWTPAPQTRVRLATEVRATYTVDDFVLPGRRPADQSAREMRMEASVDQRLWENTDIRASGSYADLRLGRLLWDRFEEIPFDTLRTYNAWVHMETGHRMRAGIGWRLYLRSDYDRRATVRYERVGPDGQPVLGGDGTALTSTITRAARRWIRQMGPTARISWQRGPSLLRLDAWANVQRVYYRLYGDLPELSEANIRRAARSGIRLLIPMVTLAVAWSL